MEMSRLTRDGTTEPVSRDQILRHARGQGSIHFPCSADHEQDWQPYSDICDDHTLPRLDKSVLRLEESEHDLGRRMIFTTAVIQQNTVHCKPRRV